VSKQRRIQVLCAGVPKWCVVEGDVAYVWYFRARIGNLDEQNLWCRCRICARSLHGFITGGRGWERGCSIVLGGSSAELLNGFRLN
jgi:hypothetical protein